MKHKQFTSKNGFTIVELLIVIVVIGILAAITIVAFNGIQQRSRNTARVSEAKDWQKIMSAYYALNNRYPATSGIFCLGTGFTDINSDGVGDCWDLDNGSNTRSENPGFLTEARTVSTIPNASRTPVRGDTGRLRVGPALDISGSTYNIVYWQEGPASEGCPVGTLRWNDGTSRSCQIVMQAL